MRRMATTIAVCAAVGSAGTAVAVACPPGQSGAQGDDSTTTTETTTTASSTSAVRDYEGTVTSVNASAGKFRLKTDRGKRVTIKVRKSTDFGDGVDSIRGLERGDDGVEVTARKTRSGLVATDVACPSKDSADDTDTTDDSSSSDSSAT